MRFLKDLPRRFKNDFQEGKRAKRRIVGGKKKSEAGKKKHTSDKKKKTSTTKKIAAK